MKNLLLIIFLICFVNIAVAGTYVKGYSRKDGTYVEPHYRQDSYKQTMKKYGVTPFNPYSKTSKSRKKISY